MKLIRVAYLLFAMALACAQVFVTLSPWTAPVFMAHSGQTMWVDWFVALFGAWIVAAAVDLVMGVLGVLPLSFAGEAVLCNASLAVLSVLNGGLLYFLCATVAPTLVLVKAIEAIARNRKALKPA